MSIPMADQAAAAYDRPADLARTIAVGDARPNGQAQDGWSRVIRSLLALASLNDDWDGLGAIAPPVAVVNTAVEIAQELQKIGAGLPESATATPAGTVLFEWHRGSSYEEVEVMSPTLVEWMGVDSDGAASHRTIPWGETNKEGIHTIG